MKIKYFIIIIVVALIQFIIALGLQNDTYITFSFSLLCCSLGWLLGKILKDKNRIRLSGHNACIVSLSMVLTIIVYAIILIISDNIIVSVLAITFTSIFIGGSLILYLLRCKK